MDHMLKTLLVLLLGLYCVGASSVELLHVYNVSDFGASMDPGNVVHFSRQGEYIYFMWAEEFALKAARADLEFKKIYKSDALVHTGQFGSEFSAINSTTGIVTMNINYVITYFLIELESMKITSRFTAPGSTGVFVANNGSLVVFDYPQEYHPPNMYMFNVHPYGFETANSYKTYPNVETISLVPDPTNPDLPGLLLGSVDYESYSVFNLTSWSFLPISIKSDWTSYPTYLTGDLFGVLTLNQSGANILLTYSITTGDLVSSTYLGTQYNQNDMVYLVAGSETTVFAVIGTEDCI